MDKILYLLYRTIFSFIALLGFKALYRLSDALYFILYKIWKYRLGIVRQNISTSFPKKSDKERLDIERSFYRQLCDNIVESIKLLHISDKQIKTLVNLENPETAESIARQKRPIILYTAHLGNWELIPAIQMFYDKPEVSAEIYKPLRQKAFNKILHKIRTRFDSVIIAQKQAYRGVLALNQKYESIIVGFVADHRSNSSHTSYHVNFLNHHTPVTVGAEKIGNHINARFLYLRVTKPCRGRYDFQLVEIQPDESAEYPYTKAYYDLLEENIKSSPGLWLWSHRRWLYQ